MPGMIRRETVASAFIFVALGCLLYLLGLILLPYVKPIAWAGVLAAVFYPVYRVLLRAMPGWPSTVAALMTTLVFVLAVVPTLLLTGVVASEAVEGYQRLAAFARESGAEQLNALAAHWLVAPVWDWAKDRMAEGDADPTSFLLSGGRWLSENLARQAASVAANAFGFLLAIGIMGFSLFFAFRDGEEMVANLENALPMAPADRRRLFERLQVTTLAVVQGLAVTAFVQGCLVAIGAWIAGVPFATLLGVFAFLLAFLPVGGAAFVWVPVTVGLFLSGQYWQGTFFSVWGVVLISSMDNILRPLLIGANAQLSTPMLFFGILGGLQAFGFLGLFVGPAVLAAFSCFAAIYRERFLEGTT